MENPSLPIRLNYVHGVIAALCIFIFAVAIFADHFDLLNAGPLPSTSILSTPPMPGYEAVTGARSVGADIIINEVDSDSPGADTAEFVELYDGGVGNTPLDGYVVVFFNGSNDMSYRAIDLDGFSTSAGGYFTLGNSAVPGVDVIFPNDGLQNGQDAVALYAASANNYPNNTPVATTNLVDALVYDNGQADDPGLLVLLSAGQPQINENGAMSGQTVSMQRCPNGSGGARNTNTYAVFAPTPDGGNVCGVPVSLSGRITNASGHGIRNAALILESGGPPATRSLTGSFGFYQFDSLQTGLYFLTVNSKRHTFLVPTRTVTLADNVSDFDFVAEPQE